MSNQKIDTSNASASTHQILNQIFGNSPASASDEQQQQLGNGSTMFPGMTTGGRNQYMEVERFDTEEQFQTWLQAQGRKWGIVQKGRVTIEDIIDQYACVYRRRKGYACRVQMRVRHNRRSGHKVVEVLPVAHDHTFYGAALPADFDDGMLSMVAPNSVVAANAAFASSLASSLSAGDLENSGVDDRQFDNGMLTELKQEFPDFSSLLCGGGDMMGNSNNNREQHQQPMDLLWSNILNNPAIQQFANGELTMQNGSEGGIDFGANGEEGGEEADQAGEEQQQPEGGQETEDGEQQLMNKQEEEEQQQQQQLQMDEDEGQQQQMLLECQTELLANCVAEKVAAYLAIEFEAKFASIITALDSLTKSVDGMKRQMATQQQQKPRQQVSEFRQQNFSKSMSNVGASVGTNGMGASNGSTTHQQQFPGTLQAFIQKKKAEKQWHPKKEPQQQQQGQLPNINNTTPAHKHQFVPMKFAPSSSASNLPSNNNAKSQITSSTSSPSIQSSNRQQSSATGSGTTPAKTNNTTNMAFMPMPSTTTTGTNNNSSSSINTSNGINSKNRKGQQQGHGQTAAGSGKSPFSARLNSVIKTAAAGRHFGIGGLALHTPMKTSRKSVHAYRQRRRELSYRFMKEVGMSLTINGITKSIFHWRAGEISAACQEKRDELIKTGKPVIYRGNDVTEMLYRVDCSRDLVNGRRCGQMIADSLWPRGYFQTRMLMPILKGVSHRSKKRVDGSARKPVASDQFEIFKVALLLLGGFLMDESDRSKWMETAREGVNQRGLDELANSKRAHYEYEGGPLFVQNGCLDDEEEEGEGEDDEEEELMMDEADEGREQHNRRRGIGEAGNDKDDDNVDLKRVRQESATEIAAYFAKLPINLDFLRSDEQQQEEDGIMPIDDQRMAFSDEDGNEEEPENDGEQMK